MSDRWNISKAEGGFIVEVYSSPVPLSEGSVIYATPPSTRVFTDTSALINFLHNELVGE